MAKTRLTVKVPAFEISNTDLEIGVHTGSQKLGTLKLSKGSVEWKPKNFTYGFHLAWSEFDRLMQAKGDRDV